MAKANVTEYFKQVTTFALSKMNLGITFKISIKIEISWWKLPHFMIEITVVTVNKVIFNPFDAL